MPLEDAFPDSELLSAVDPTVGAKAIATEQLTLMSLRFHRGGAEFNAREFIQRFKVSKLVGLRKLLRHAVHTQGRKRLVCASCGSPVFLAALAAQPNGHEFY